MPRGLLDALVDLGLGRLAQLQAEGHVVVDRHVRVQGVALEDHRDVAILRGDVVDDALADLEVALGDLLEAGDHPQAGGLAAAGRADQDHELAVLDLEVEVLDGGEVAEALPDVIERHGGHVRTPPRPMATSRALASRRDWRSRRRRAPYVAPLAGRSRSLPAASGAGTLQARPGRRICRRGPAGPGCQIELAQARHLVAAGALASKQNGQPFVSASTSSLMNILEIRQTTKAMIDEGDDRVDECAIADRRTAIGIRG